MCVVCYGLCQNNLYSSSKIHWIKKLLFYYYTLIYTRGSFYTNITIDIHDENIIDNNTIDRHLQVEWNEDLHDCRREAFKLTSPKDLRCDIGIKSSHQWIKYGMKVKESDNFKVSVT